VGGRAEDIAQAFHESYERLAPRFGYETRESSAVPWSEVPAENKALMVAVASELLERQVIEVGVPDSPGFKIERALVQFDESTRRPSTWRSGSMTRGCSGSRIGCCIRSGGRSA
jgi:hypothetical protein